VAALRNRRFRTLLLAISGVPIAALYVWQALIQPIFLGGYLGDFQESYLRAAGRITSGQDPYALCATMGCLEPTGPQYVMPPVLAWMLQPLVHVDAQVITVGAVLVLNASLFLFLWLTIRALGVRDWQLAALLVLLAIAFEPVTGNIAEGQVNLVLLGLSGVWFAAWTKDRWWGGLALGAAVALKLIQGPTVLLVLWARRWAMLAAAAAAGLVLWLAGAPQYLFEYLTKVLPAVSAGTGFFENHSPGGTITRLFDPNTFVVVRGSPTPARVLTTVVGVVVLVATLVALRSCRNRALDAGAIVAATPLIASYSWGTHLVLLLLPMFVLVAWSIPRHDWLVLSLVAVSWILIGPVHKLLQALLVSGYTDFAVLRVLAEAGVVGIAALWIATLVAVRRSADRLDTAHEGGAEDHEDHGARKHDPIPAVPVRTV
jgi:glycosyl transferase family 87